MNDDNDDDDDNDYLLVLIRLTIQKTPKRWTVLTAQTVSYFTSYVVWKSVRSSFLFDFYRAACNADAV